MKSYICRPKGNREPLLTAFWALEDEEKHSISKSTFWTWLQHFDCNEVVSVFLSWDYCMWKLRQCANSHWERQRGVYLSLCEVHPSTVACSASVLSLRVTSHSSPSLLLGTTWVSTIIKISEVSLFNSQTDRHTDKHCALWPSVFRPQLVVPGPPGWSLSGCHGLSQITVVSPCRMAWPRREINGLSRDPPSDQIF